jgi:hypothetical protein
MKAPEIQAPCSDPAGQAVTGVHETWRGRAKPVYVVGLCPTCYNP